MRTAISRRSPPDFVDRSGVVHPDAGSGIAIHLRSVGDAIEWEIDYAVKVVPGKTLLETPEEFCIGGRRTRIMCMSQWSRHSVSLARVSSGIPVRKRVPVRGIGQMTRLAGEVNYVQSGGAVIV